MVLAYSAAKDTLAYQLGVRPLTRMIDFSEVPAPVVMAEFKDALPGSKAVPETEALWFYLMNHAVARVREIKAPNEPLGEHLWIVEEFHRQLTERAVRLFRYLMMICTREARHANSQMASKWVDFEAQFGPEITKFCRDNLGKSSSDAANHIQKSPPDAPIGLYVRGLQYIFDKPSWGGGYGGKKWGAVTDCLVQYVHGKYTAEMMMDTGWTLSHNNGPIFNKGMLYEMYDGGMIARILDVQRSGQIPQLIFEGWVDARCPKDLKAMNLKLNEALPGMIPQDKPYVDWFLVEQLGGIHSWNSEKAAQTKKHGTPKDLSEKLAAAEAKAKAEELAKEAAKADKMKNQWEVFPGEFVQKFTPVRENVEVVA